MNGENIQSIIVVKVELELGRKIADSPTNDTVANGSSYRYLASVKDHEPDMIYLREPTKPDAGVIATRPVTAPEQKPTTDHLRSIR